MQLDSIVPRAVAPISLSSLGSSLLLLFCQLLVELSCQINRICGTKKKEIHFPGLHEPGDWMVTVGVIESGTLSSVLLGSRLNLVG